MRSTLLVAAIAGVPALALAQGTAAARARPQSIVVTAPSIRVRTAPSMLSISIEEVARGQVFALASDENHSKDWVGIVLDGRVAFLPRYAIGLRSQSVQLAAASAPAMVVQAGMPAPATPAPARSAAPAGAAAQPVSTPAATAPPSAAPAAATTRAPEPVPERVAARAPEPVPARASEPAPERVAAAAPVTAPARDPERQPAPPAERPAVSRRGGHVGLTLGAFASVTPADGNGITPSNTHVAGLSFVGVTYRGWGIYAAPEMGNGAGYRSTLLGGGLSRDLISMHLLRVTALAGYATYEQKPTDLSLALGATTSALRGASFGGMASIPLVGPVRLGYRGQYVKGTYEGVEANLTRHSVGLVF